MSVGTAGAVTTRDRGGRAAVPAQAGSTPRFDAAAAVLGVMLVGGVHLDGWAHLHRGLVETFFTPWHGVLYSAYLLLAAVLAGAVWTNRRTGYLGRRAIPAGYEPALIGAGLFALGGAGDMIWHILFGIEVDLEALLSPTHLLLAAGGALLVSGPLLAAWRRARREITLPAFIPAALSAAAMLSVLSFMTQYMHPFGTTWAAAPRSPDLLLRGVGEATVRGFSLEAYFGFFEQVTALAGVVVQSAALVGLLFVLLRRWRLPAGGVALIVVTNAAFTVFMRTRFLDTGPLPLLAAAAAGGLILEVLAARLRPSPARPAAMRLFGAAAPAALYGGYFLALGLGPGLWWRVHLWLGAVVLAGLTGWLLSYVAVPPALPAEALAERA